MWWFPCAGSKKAFAAGADIKEMLPRTYTQCYTSNMFANWAEVAKLKKPVSSPPHK
jgi:enoyl-CoA hydratase/carnithine racemase